MSAMSEQKTDYVPKGYHSLTPFLAVAGGAKALDYYGRAFGAEVISRMDGPDGMVMHAELRIGDSIFQVSDEMPDLGLRAPSRDSSAFALTIYCPDADAVQRRAIEAGGTEISPVADFVSGDRFGRVMCPFGHRWVIATHVKDVSPEQ